MASSTLDGKDGKDPYSGSRFVAEDSKGSCESLYLTCCPASLISDKALPATSMSVHWGGDVGPTIREAIPQATNALQVAQVPVKATKIRHWSRNINYMLAALLLGVITALALAKGEDISYLLDHPAITTPFILSLRRYVPPSDTLSFRMRRQVDTGFQDILIAQIGRRDHALAADGGSIYARLTSGPTWLLAAGNSHPAQVLLRDNLHGGRCWAFDGSRGQVGIRVPTRIRPTAITIDHVPRQVADDPQQAPHRLRLWAAVDGEANKEKFAKYTASSPPAVANGPLITHGYTFMHLADFRYDLDMANPVQTFSIHPQAQALGMDFGVFVVEVLDNWGGSLTCVYRIRLHGEPV